MYNLLALCYALVTNCSPTPTPLHQLLSWQQHIAALSLSEGVAGSTGLCMQLLGGLVLSAVRL